MHSKEKAPSLESMGVVGLSGATFARSAHHYVQSRSARLLGELEDSAVSTDTSWHFCLRLM
jgi:hypothetical protein